MRSAVITFAATLAASTAMASELPQPSTASSVLGDPHMQVVDYKPDQVFEMHLMKGRTAAIELPPAETSLQSYGSDNKYMQADIPPGTNLVFLKPTQIMSPRPFYIVSAIPEKAPKIYALQIDVSDTAPPTLPYRLKFRDPNAEVAVKQAAWHQQVLRKKEMDKEAALRFAVAHPVDTNKHYVLQGETVGDWNILPSRRVADDGINTHFYFAGSPRAVQIYIPSADGDRKKDALVDCSPDSETHITTCHQLSREWRLRDGDSELCVHNHAFSAISPERPSGTIRDDVRRELRTDR